MFFITTTKNILFILNGWCLRLLINCSVLENSLTHLITVAELCDTSQQIDYLMDLTDKRSLQINLQVQACHLVADDKSVEWI